MNTKNDPAFPSLLTGKWAGTGADAKFAPDMTDGLTKLEWFAGMALQGMLAAGLPPSANGMDEYAFRLAEAMVVEAEKRKVQS